MLGLIPTSRLLPVGKKSLHRLPSEAEARPKTSAPAPLKCWGFRSLGFRQTGSLWAPPGMDVTTQAHSAVPPAMGLFNPANDKDRSGHSRRFHASDRSAAGDVLLHSGLTRPCVHVRVCVQLRCRVRGRAEQEADPDVCA